MDKAERLYYAAISTRLVKRAFCAEAAHLEANSPGAGEYLRWLMVRGQAWPSLEPGGVHTRGLGGVRAYKAGPEPCDSNSLR